jgi:DNA-binding response OmpR family regulator
MENKNTILIIEDEPVLSEVLIDKFTNEGFNVLSAKDGQEGLDVIEKNTIDLILLDIVMPKMDGITMLKKLKDKKLKKQPEIIMLTNLSGTNTMADAIENGSFEYLIKSEWKIEDLVKKVKEKFN